MIGTIWEMDSEINKWMYVVVREHSHVCGGSWELMVLQTGHIVHAARDIQGTLFLTTTGIALRRYKL